MRNFDAKQIAKARFSTITVFGWEWQTFHTTTHDLAQSVAQKCRALGITTELLIYPIEDKANSRALYLVVARCSMYRFRRLAGHQVNKAQRTRAQWQQGRRAARRQQRGANHA